MPIGIDVVDRDHAWTIARTEGCGRTERPVAISEEDRSHVRPLNRYCEIELAVLVQIACGYRPTHHSANCEAGREAERSVTVAEENRNVITVEVGDSQIEFGVPVEVRDRQVDRRVTGGSCLHGEGGTRAEAAC